MALATSCYFLLLLLLVSATSASPSSEEAASDDNGATSVGDRLMSERFEQWMARYNRSYSTAAEKRRRFQVYMANVLYIEAANGEPGLTYELGENEFTDLTNDEFVVMYTGGYAPPEQAGAQNDEEEMLITTRVGDITDGVNYKMTEELMHDNLSAAPTSIDWRKRRAVTPVKNQGQCGSCWAFSAVASIESLHKIKKKGALKSLSEQQLVDCDTRNNGCNGGQMSRAFDWVKLNGGITTESDYPYTAKKGACKKDKLKNHAAKITGYVRVTANKEALLMDAVARQPVSVAIEAGGANFQHYRRGVYKGPCGTKLNHGVTVVGYGKDTTGTKYWIVKNSWGKSWGLNGYIWMEKDINKPQGLCGIAMQPVYPTM